MNRQEIENFLDAPDEPKQKARMSANEAASFLDEPDESVVDFVGREVAATPRVVGSTLAGLLAWPIQKSYGVWSIATGGSKEDALAAEEYVASKIPSFLQPKTKSEMAAINKLGVAMEAVVKPAHMAGESTGKLWDKRAGYIVSLIGELLTFKGLHKLGSTGKVK